MAEAPDPRIGTTLEGRYRVIERLAAGGMGVVYKGELVAIGKPVAIKFLHDALTLIPDVVKRFEREATAMSKLAHPNLVSVLDSGLAAGTPYLVMDFVSGKSLAEVLAEGPLPATRAAGLARQILAGVQRGARAARRASRSQARQHHASRRRRGRLRQDPRLRAGQGAARRGLGGVAADQHRLRARHAGLHVARAGARHRGRRAQRSLRASASSSITW